MKSFLQQKKDKKLITASKVTNYLKGKKVKILASVSGHAYGQVNDVIIFSNSVNISGQNVYDYGISPLGGYIRFSEFSVIGSLTKEDIEKEIKTYKQSIKSSEKDIKACEDKLKYIKETGSEVYNENEFKAYQTLTLLENKKLSKLEKAKLISGLIEA